MKGCHSRSDEEVKLISQLFGGTLGERNKALFVAG